jgi:hypothetical protein
MTAQRRERKGWRRGIALIALLAGLANAGAATSERVVTNRFSGVAIGGFDPVAYFTDAQPVKGLAELEATQAGAVWRFRNEANRAFFVAHPEIYGPQFGGYDPVDVARGVAVAGNPQIWMISDKRLYLFAREQSRAAFALNPSKISQEALKRWQGLQSALQ